jgi:membrane-associated phospholipid phosphatase
MRGVSAVAGVLLICAGGFGQEPPEKSTSGASQTSSVHQHQPTRCDLKTIGQCLKDVGHDQIGIWTSPLRIKSHDALWLVPFAGATAAAFAYDQDALRQVDPNNKTQIDRSEIISKFGSGYATFGEAGVVYLTGVFTHNDHLRETGVLGAEAVIDASIVAGALKLATNRERPDHGDGTGGFWPHGPSDYTAAGSFPSGHAASSWALARVISAEYPGWLTRLGAYGFATLISASRITARRHFPSDVVVGGTFGYLIGGYVVRHHSSLDQEEKSFTVMPIMDDSQRTYGLTVTFTPGGSDLPRMGRSFKKLGSVSEWIRGTNHGQPNP